MSENRYLRRREARINAAVIAARAPSPMGWTVVLLGLLALAIQSFVVQTHIHIPQNTVSSVSSILLAPPSDGVLTAKAVPNPADAPHDKYPIDEDPANRPLCQELTHTGQFVMPTAALFALPVFINFSVIVFSESATYVSAVSHNWHGRAPPLN